MNRACVREAGIVVVAIVVIENSEIKGGFPAMAYYVTSDSIAAAGGNGSRRGGVSSEQHHGLG
jgi:hypothetical protein